MISLKNKITGTHPFLLHRPGQQEHPTWVQAISRQFTTLVPPELTVITFNTRTEPGIFQSRVHPKGVHVLGRGLTTKTKENKVDLIQLKIAYVADWIRCVRTPYILMCDSYDVIPLRPLADLLEAYTELFPNFPLVYSAEKHFWPGYVPTKELEERMAPANSPFKYLNTGCIIGETAFIYHVFNLFKMAVPMIDPLATDQGLTKVVWGTGQPFDERNQITLDYQCQLFQNLPLVDPNDLEFD